MHSNKGIKKNNFLLLTLLLLLLVLSNIFIFLDILVLRLVFGIIFYSIIPGALILSILNLGKVRSVVSFILSWGLSISLIIFSGLLINYLYPLFGYKAPLSTNSLVISFNIIILVLILTVFWRGNSNYFTNIFDFHIGAREKIYLLLPAFFPFAGILGIYIMNTKDNNALLIVLHLLIVAYVIFISLNHERVPERVYAPLIYLISISLVLLLPLRSNHLIGVDVHAEYYIFQQTVQIGHWSVIHNRPLDACLSISILPAVYQSFLGIDPEHTFKILYPILFSVSPLVIYVISNKYMEGSYAFLASVFFMSQNSFLWTAAGPRSRLAVLFFALALMVLFSDEVDDIRKRLLFIIFALSCIVSHYSTAYIFFILLLSMLLGMRIIRWVCLSGKSPINYKNHLNGHSNSLKITYELSCSLLRPHFTSGMLVIIFIAIFLWYSQITGAAFDYGVKFIEQSLLSLQNLFVIESRDDEVQAIFGQHLESEGIARRIEFIFVWLAIAFIAIGVLTTLARYCKCVAHDDALNKGFYSSLFYRRLDVEFFTASVICSALLVISIALPFVLKGYSMQRTFFQTMVVLSIFFVIGGITIAEVLHFPKRGHLMVLFVLITFFMSITGVTYQILGDPRSIIFNTDVDAFDSFYIYDQETLSAKWLGKKIEPESNVYADFSGHSRVVSQGLISIYSTYNIVRYFERDTNLNGYIYLRKYNIADGKLIGPRPNEEQDFIRYLDRISINDKLYGSGASEIWKIS